MGLGAPRRHLTELGWRVRVRAIFTVFTQPSASVQHTARLAAYEGLPLVVDAFVRYRDGVQCEAEGRIPRPLTDTLSLCDIGTLTDTLTLAQTLSGQRLHVTPRVVL